MPTNKPLRELTLFIEGDRGVMETTVGMFEMNGKTFFKPTATTLCSGAPPLISRSILHTALATQEWFDSHPEVIVECRVWSSEVK